MPGEHGLDLLLDAQGLRRGGELVRCAAQAFVEFVELAAQNNVLVVPGGVFSQHDTHFRISYATNPARLSEGLDTLARLMSK